MKYQDFFENMLPGGMGDNLSASSVDPQELQKGIETEIEHTEDERLAKEIALDHLAEDPRYYSKLSAAGMDHPAPKINMPPGGMGGQSPVGGIVTPTAIGVSIAGGSHKTPDGKMGTSAGLKVSAPDDKEPITAAGQTDTSFAEKTVGGEAADGEGQEQGGPNTQGNIADTPKNTEITSGASTGGRMVKRSTPSNAAISGGSGEPETKEPAEKEDDDEKEMETQLKEIIKSEIKSVLREMWSVKEGQAQYKIVDGSEQTEQPGKVMRARVNQEDPTVQESIANEEAPPGFPEDLAQKLAKQYGSDSPKKFATMWSLHNKGQVQEVQRRLAEMASHKIVNGKTLARTQEPMHARVVQTDPEVTEASYKIQTRSHTTFADSPQFPKTIADPESPTVS